MSDLPKCLLCGAFPVRLYNGDMRHRNRQCSLRGMRAVTADQWTALMGRGEPVGYVFRRSICSDHDPADCEEYDDFVSRADVDLEELAEYEKHGMVMEVYAKAPAVDGAVPNMFWDGGNTYGQNNIKKFARKLLAAATRPEAGQQSDPWVPSVFNYDRSIHSNPDAKAWADLFVQTFPGLAGKHDLMLGWFANAMMAMHDHLAKQQPATRPVPTCETCNGTVINYGTMVSDEFLACFDSAFSFLANGHSIGQCFDMMKFAKAELIKSKKNNPAPRPVPTNTVYMCPDHGSGVYVGLPSYPAGCCFVCGKRPEEPDGGAV